MALDVEFENPDLARLESDPTFTGGWDPAIVKAFRRRMQQIRAATDERDLYAIRSLRFKKMKGNRSDEHSMRLNDQWRLIARLYDVGQSKRIRIIGIEDYH
jgi:proteic killer suppression protein